MSGERIALVTSLLLVITISIIAIAINYQRYMVELKCDDRKCDVGKPIAAMGECWCWIRAEKVP